LHVYPEELKKEAVQMLLDGHSASSVADNLGIGHTSLLYRISAASPRGERPALLSEQRVGKGSPRPLIRHDSASRNSAGTGKVN